MIRTDESGGKSLKELRKIEQQEKEKELRVKCEALAFERYGEEKIKQLTNKYKGLFYLPILGDDEETIEKMAVLKPIDRHILSYASTKIDDDGLYEFLGAVLKSCWLEGDMEIQEDDNYFIPACQNINSLMKGKKAYLVKR